MSNYSTTPPGETDSVQLKTFNDLKNSLAPIDWLWNDWLPKGFLTIFAADSGKGKSTLCLSLAASITDGWSWPDSMPSTENGRVVWCEAEASQAVNIDRATKWGISTNRLLLPLDDPLEDVNLDNGKHREKIRTAASITDVKLVIVDSLSGSNRRDENSSNMLGLTKFLAETARNTNVPFLLTHHLRKKNLLDTEAVEIDRLRGSSAIVQAARVVWALDAPNPRSDFMRLRVLKSNIGKLPPPIGCQIDEKGVQFGEAPEKIQKSTALGTATEFLEQLLKDGPVDARFVEEEANKCGVQKRTLNIAKQILGIQSQRVGGQNGKWVWRLS